MAWHCRNARVLVEFLAAHPKVAAVHWPGLPAHRNHAVAAAQMSDFGAMFSLQVKGGREAGLGDYEYFKSRFGGPPRQGGPGPGRGQADGPQPPAGNPLEIVMAECDVVTIVHKNFRQDPTAAPGTWYEVFTFDTFRVRNGKLVEHWDGAVINPPAPGRGN